jgi:hypothetical protein
MSRKFLHSVVLPGIVILAAACAQQGQQTEQLPAEEPAPAPETAMPEPAMGAMGAMLELTPEKINELAMLAAQMEKDPMMAADLLAQHGMTQEQVNDAMSRIAADPAMQQAFDAAKAAAAAAPATEAAPAGE